MKEESMPDQTIYFRITTVSPLHVGCDEVYEPTSFVIDSKEKELVSFETAAFLELLDSDALEKFSTICKKGTIVSLLELLKFMRSQAELADGRRIRIPDEFIRHYESTLDLPQNEKAVERELNSFQIKRTAFDFLTGTPYIPGSAIKGAIRTAVLNQRNQRSKAPGFRGRNAGRELQEHLLDFDFRHLESDPFRLFKVSDFFPVNEAARAIVYAVDQKKKPSEREAQAPYQILEAVEPGAEFAGTVTILSSPGRDAGIRKPLTLDEITSAIETFFGSEKQREDRELTAIGVRPPALDLNGRVLPMRIGRHSGAECVTVGGHRHIKIMQGRGNPEKYLDHATTVWLAADAKKPTTSQGMKPFGWVRIEQLPVGDGLQALQETERRKSAVLESLQDRIAVRKIKEEEIRENMIKEQRAAAEKEARLAAEEAERVAAEEAERRTLATMSEAERQARVIQKKGTPENEIVELYNELDRYSDADQKIIAAALRDRWMADKKWSKKECSKKQWEKVQKVKNLLGDE